MQLNDLKFNKNKIFLKLILVLLISALAFSCNPISNTEEEKNAALKIVEFFGGTCTTIKGISTSKGKWVLLQMSGSDLLKNYSFNMEIPASNAAYIYYSNLGNNHYTFDEIHVEFPQFKKKYRFKIDELKLIKEQIPIFLKTADFIKSQSYMNLYSLYVPNNYDTSKFKSTFELVDADLGIAKNIQFHGFKQAVLDTPYYELIKFFGVIGREKSNVPFQVDVDRKTKKIVAITDNMY